MNLPDEPICRTGFPNAAAATQLSHVRMHSSPTPEVQFGALAERLNHLLSALALCLGVLVPNAALAQPVDAAMEEAIADMEAETASYDKTPVPASSARTAPVSLAT